MNRQSLSLALENQTSLRNKKTKAARAKPASALLCEIMLTVSDGALAIEIVIQYNGGPATSTCEKITGCHPQNEAFETAFQPENRRVFQLKPGAEG